MRRFHDNDIHAWGIGIFTVVAVLAVLLLVLLVMLALRYAGHAPRRPGGAPPAAPDWAGPARPPAEQLLAERFARGEIDTAEYRERLAALRNGPAPGGG
jgi:putative membrane protein